MFYVWFDAPIEYIGATREWADAAPGSSARDWKSWWVGEEAQAKVRYVQFMGKDNVPFHTVGFPVTILGSGEKWKLVDQIKGFNWLNYYAGKFSTSQKRGVFMDTALEILPPDYWRWYLTANAPESSDASFTWQHFSDTVNKDLADVLGNFVNRTLKFTQGKWGSVIPEGGKPGPKETKLADELERRFGLYSAFLEDIQHHVDVHRDRHACFCSRCSRCSCSPAPGAMMPLAADTLDGSTRCKCARRLCACRARNASAEMPCALV